MSAYTVERIAGRWGVLNGDDVIASFGEHEQALAEFLAMLLGSPV